jgi:hypothetical protein
VSNGPVTVHKAGGHENEEAEGCVEGTGARCDEAHDFRGDKAGAIWSEGRAEVVNGAGHGVALPKAVNADDNNEFNPLNANLMVPAGCRFILLPVQQVGSCRLKRW